MHYYALLLEMSLTNPPYGIHTASIPARPFPPVIDASLPGV